MCPVSTAADSRICHPTPRPGHGAVEVYATAARLDHGDLIAKRTGVEGGVKDAEVGGERNPGGLGYRRRDADDAPPPRTST
jgi:hypothetical protein